MSIYVLYVYIILFGVLESNLKYSELFYFLYNIGINNNNNCYI